MNYLFHLFLSGTDPDILTGNFAGDFIKGRLENNCPSKLRQGAQLHRHIDSFAHHNAFFNRSRSRLSPHLGLYRGVFIDLYYDHFLSLYWDRFSEEPLEKYLTRVRQIVEKRRAILPPRLQNLLPLIFEDFIPSYRSIEGVGYALSRLGRRVRQPNPLSEGEAELVRHYEGLLKDFLTFLPQVQISAEAFLDGDKLMP